MRLKLLTAAGVLSLLWFVSAQGQVNTNRGPIAAKVVVSGQTNLLLVYPQFPNILLATNLNKAFPRQKLSTNQISPQLLTPGLYKTEPYTCIVIVPNKTADDRAVVKSPESGHEMPVVKPELRFVPIPGK
jgi:hypothetical protein